MSNPNAPETMAQGIAKLATDFEKNSFDSAPEFTLNTFFRKHSDDDYELLTEEPVGWAYNYNNYYHEPRYTDPNLHRRIESDIQPETVVVDGREFTQTQPSEYSVGVFGVESYRTIKSYYHNEESTESEVP